MIGECLRTKWQKRQGKADRAIEAAADGRGKVDSAGWPKRPD